MTMILVGVANGRRRICWRTVLALGIGLGSFGAAVSSAVYAGLSGEFSIVAALVGAVGPLVTLGCGVRQACRLPLSALSRLPTAADEAT